MSVCAIVVSFRTGNVLEACLHALGKARGLDEIVVVDNGNPPPEINVIDALARADARVRVLRGHGNVGFARACNMGARTAVSDTLVFVNPDVILEPDAVAGLMAALASAPPPAIVGGDLRDAEGRPDRGSRRERLTPWRAFVSAAGLSRFERAAPMLRDFNRHTDPVPDAAQAVSVISGALLAIRRQDFEALGRFDEGYFLHVEDIDLCRRAEEAGWFVLFAPGPHGVHVRSSSNVAARDITRHKARSMARYFTKFADGPIERMLARMAGALLVLIAR